MSYVLRTRTKKFIGIFFMLLLTFFYCIITVTLAGGIANAHWSVHLLFFAAATVPWLLGAMGIVKWMLTDNGRG